MSVFLFVCVFVLIIIIAAVWINCDRRINDLESDNYVLWDEHTKRKRR